jgi:hypothetical protein
MLPVDCFSLQEWLSQLFQFLFQPKFATQNLPAAISSPFQFV